MTSSNIFLYKIKLHELLFWKVLPFLNQLGSYRKILQKKAATKEWGAVYMNFFSF